MPGKRGSDRRVTKTRRAIRRAFAKLSAEKNVNDITILELARKADINRKTFYNHYAGIYAVVEEIEDEICSELDGLLKETDLKGMLEDPEAVFSQLTQVVNQNMDLYGSLIIDNDRLITKMGRMLEERSRASLVESFGIDAATADLLLGYVLSGILHVFRTWYLGGRVQSPEEISRLVSTLSQRGIQGVLGLGDKSEE